MENFGSKEDTYSQIFSSLKHPIRRAILKMLADDQESYSDMLDELKIDSPKLNYHIQGLDGLVYKAENGKYQLSNIGEAAIELMKNVEHPASVPISHPLIRHSSWRSKLISIIPIIMVVLGIGFIILGASLFLNAVLPQSHMMTIQTQPTDGSLGVSSIGYVFSMPTFPNPQATTGLFWLALGIVLAEIGGMAAPLLYLKQRLSAEERRIENLEKATNRS